MRERAGEVANHFPLAQVHLTGLPVHPLLAPLHLLCWCHHNGQHWAPACLGKTLVRWPPDPPTVQHPDHLSFSFSSSHSSPPVWVQVNPGEEPPGLRRPLWSSWMTADWLNLAVFSSLANSSGWGRAQLEGKEEEEEKDEKDEEEVLCSPARSVAVSIYLHISYWNLWLHCVKPSPRICSYQDSSSSSTFLINAVAGWRSHLGVEYDLLEVNWS